MKWISIFDKSPIKEGRYLVLYSWRNDSTRHEHSIGFFRIEHGHGWDNNMWKDFSISHWMPLPKPPKEEE